MARSADLRDALRQRVGELMRTDPAHDMAHLDRVWENARQIASGDSANMDVLLAAAYLHDLVNVPKTDPDRAQVSIMSSRAAIPVLEALGFEPDTRHAVCHAIEAHSFSAGISPRTPEAKILRDADRLDALGAIGIARTFMVATQVGAALYDPADPFATKRPLDDTRFALDHWQTKLLKLPDGMLTDMGKELADTRANVMRHFLADLAEDIGATLPRSLRPVSDQDVKSVE
ncbi:MAG: HD domain-containing protein [Arenibacterium sp.]